MCWKFVKLWHRRGRWCSSALLRNQEIPINEEMTVYKGKKHKFEIKTKYETVNFSNPNLDARSVLEDFGIHYNESLKECKWDLDSEKEILNVPKDCRKFVALYLQRTSGRLEKSARFFVTTIALTALNSLEDVLLVFDDEKKLECVVNNKLYTGNIDMALGHSLVDKKIADDSSMLVVEAKQGSTFANGLGQVIAQAATAFKLREKNERANGKDGLPIFLIRTDGFKWQFGKPNDKLLLKTSSTISINGAYDSEDFKQSLSKVYSWFVKIVTEISTSSPRLKVQFE